MPEAKFVPWLTGDAVPGDDDGDLMAVVRTLALWAGQPMPEPRDRLPLATATRTREAADAERKPGGLLTKSVGLIGGIITTVIGGNNTSSSDPWVPTPCGVPEVCLACELQ